MTLVEYLQASASRSPDSLAAVDCQDGRLTFAELNDRATALAAFLTSSGVRRGDRVGIVLPKSVSALVACFAVMKAGAAYVPVDVAAPVSRTREILQDCLVSAVIVDRRSLDAVPDLPLAAVIVDGETQGARRSTALQDALRCGRTRAGDAVELRGSDLAYVIYTSGSTGKPKGVMITHDNATTFVDWCATKCEVSAEDRVANHSPFHFDPSAFDLFAAVKHGAPVYLIDDRVGRHSGALAEFIAAHRLSVWVSTPAILSMLVQTGAMEGHDFSAMRVAIVGGEVCSVGTLRTLKRHWHRATIYNMYGPTETTTACTYYRIPDVIPDDRTTPYPIGRPFDYARARVIDDRGGEAPAGKQGVLHIGGPAVAAGYWNRPQETAEAFYEEGGIRWYNTGDLVRVDATEGLIFAGRRDRMVKRRGYRIELDEIEAALRAHPAIEEAAVIAVASVPDVPVSIVAVVAMTGEPQSTVALKTYLADKLPAYMSPDRFVFRSKLPRTSTHKTDYSRLACELATTAPGDADRTLEGRGTPSETPA